MTFITAAEAAKIAEQNKPTVTSITKALDDRVKNAMSQGARSTSIQYGTESVSFDTLEEVKKVYLEHGFIVEIFTESPVYFSLTVKF